MCPEVSEKAKKSVTLGINQDIIKCCNHDEQNTVHASNFLVWEHSKIFHTNEYNCFLILHHFWLTKVFTKNPLISDSEGNL